MGQWTERGQEKDRKWTKVGQKVDKGQELDKMWDPDIVNQHPDSTV